ncbi:Integrase core domain-containing protein [Devosia psychrophila]|uniref:Integrase core domain-containing protein n=1 Tax=Devosia psychrophila TaxID=728005 RepID=A0A1I1QNT4_9HYPH|nr:Integrase core domain-containing protein [Devosia psychrophila]
MPGPVCQQRVRQSAPLCDAASQKRRFKRTTDSEHSWPVAPNLLDQVFEARGPDEKWGVDISYIWTRQGWLYLSVVLDLFSRRIVGWTTSDRLHRALALSALRKALVMRQPAAGLIHHWDSGSQGGFNRSSQHWVISQILDTHSRLRLVSSN